MRSAVIALLATIASGCADAGRDRVTFPLYLAGSDLGAPLEADDGAVVRVDRAELAFGPLYLCAGHQAGALCDTARAEWLEGAVVDALNPEPRLAGDVSGVSGSVRSWMYDLGISSLLTRTEPLPLPAAERLGGVSLRIEGRAESGGRSLAFRAEIPIQQEEETEIGVPVVRKSTTDAFDHDLAPGERGLLIRFDPAPWVADIDFAALLLDCAAATSCRDTELGPDTQGHRTLRNALVAGARPSFEWGFAP